MNRFAMDLSTRPAISMLPRACETRMEMADRPQDAKPSLASAGRRGAIAVIPIHGALAARDNAVDGWFWADSYENIGRSISAAVRDDGVGGVVLDVDSPGGDATGMSELAAAIRDLRGQKPIVAYVNTLAASAAYGLASAADRIFAPPSAIIGSVGTYSIHVDQSKMLEDAGVKVTFIFAGRYKVEGNPYQPLSDEALAHEQEIVDSLYTQFLDTVAAGRGITSSDVRKGYGEGRVFVADEAKRRGMIDGIKTVDQLWATMGAGEGASRRSEIDLLRRREKSRERNFA